MGSKRELEPDHDVQPVGKKRKKARTSASPSHVAARLMHELISVYLATQVKAMMAAAQVAIAEVRTVQRLPVSCVHTLQHSAMARHSVQTII